MGIGQHYNRHPTKTSQKVRSSLATSVWLLYPQLTVCVVSNCLLFDTNEESVNIPTKTHQLDRKNISGLEMETSKKSFFIFSEIIAGRRRGLSREENYFLLSECQSRPDGGLTLEMFQSWTSCLQSQLDPEECEVRRSAQSVICLSVCRITTPWSDWRRRSSVRWRWTACLRNVLTT